MSSCTLLWVLLCLCAYVHAVELFVAPSVPGQAVTGTGTQVDPYSDFATAWERVRTTADASNAINLLTGVHPLIGRRTLTLPTGVDLLVTSADDPQSGVLNITSAAITITAQGLLSFEDICVRGASSEEMFKVQNTANLILDGVCFEGDATLGRDLTSTSSIESHDCGIVEVISSVLLEWSNSKYGCPMA